MRRVILAGVGAVLIMSISAYAGANLTGKVVIHVLPHGSRTCTENFPVITACEDIITSTAASDVDAFPVFFDLVEYEGFEYGLTWPGSYSCLFTSCSDLAVGTIVLPGDGISQSWYACQPGPVAVCGWGWITDWGFVYAVPHPVAGGPNIQDCSGGTDPTTAWFAAGIGGYYGDDPCRPVTGDLGTWGSIKSMFE